jgi:3-oxoacyl-[acyl-carrier protein] reductase
MAVVVGYASSTGAAEEVVAENATAGGSAVADRADVADQTAVAAMFDTAEEAFGGIDVVVNCAGRMSLAPIADLDLDDLDVLHRTNIRGTFVVAREAARRIRTGDAVVLFSTSVAGLQIPTYGAYAASKGAVEAMTLILARELRGRDVTVNTVAPGPTAIELLLDGKTEDQIASLAGQPPLERLGETSDIAEMVAFLAGPARWVNGQVLRVNGGIV